MGTDTMYSEDLIKEAVQKEMVNFNNNNNNNQYTTVNKDGKKMAIIDADQLGDGLIIVPGNQRVQSTQCLLSCSV